MGLRGGARGNRLLRYRQAAAAWWHRCRRRRPAVPGCSRLLRGGAQIDRRAPASEAGATIRAAAEGARLPCSAARYADPRAASRPIWNPTAGTRNAFNAPRPSEPLTPVATDRVGAAVRAGSTQSDRGHFPRCAARWRRTPWAASRYLGATGLLMAAFRYHQVPVRWLALFSLWASLGPVLGAAWITGAHPALGGFRYPKFLPWTALAIAPIAARGGIENAAGASYRRASRCARALSALAAAAGAAFVAAARCGLVRAIPGPTRHWPTICSGGVRGRVLGVLGTARPGDSRCGPWRAPASRRFTITLMLLTTSSSAPASAGFGYCVTSQGPIAGRLCITGDPRASRRPSCSPGEPATRSSRLRSPARQSHFALLEPRAGGVVFRLILAE